MIYRYSNNGHENPLDLYLSSKTINVDLTDTELLNTSLDINYKSDFLRNWYTYNLLKVKLCLEKNIYMRDLKVSNQNKSNAYNIKGIKKPVVFRLHRSPTNKQECNEWSELYINLQHNIFNLVFVFDFHFWIWVLLLLCLDFGFLCFGFNATDKRLLLEMRIEHI